MSIVTFRDLGNLGRFGNQLFQISSTIGIADRNKIGYKFPDWSYSRFFNHSLPQGIVDNINIKRHEERTTYYYDIMLDSRFSWDIHGYFQSFKYFDHIKDQIAYYFEYKTPRETKDVVSIHVRRGDYVALQEIHPLLGMEYYKKAVQYFGTKEAFFVFSDDPAWCRKTFKKTFKHGTFMYDMGSPDILAWFEMSCCKHHIIANSSFSWWAAYLNPNPDKVVIAPNVWVSSEDRLDDRILPDWKILQKGEQ